MTRVLLKVGGAQLQEPEARKALCQSVAAARADGVHIVIVHGGGNQIRDLTARLGMEDRYHDGLRITDAPTADLAVMVLGGLVNRTLVADLGAHGVPSVGVTGADGGLFSAARHRATAPDGKPVDLGYVGTVQDVQPSLIDHLLEQGYCPVVGSVAPLDHASEEPQDHFYNINADTLAGALASALGCEQMLFLTDVKGVRDSSGQTLSHIDPSSSQALIASGTIHGGMIPKVEAAFRAAAASGTQRVRVKIASAQGHDAVRNGMRHDVGTTVTP